MLRIVVRAKKDRDAVKAAVERFFPGWGISVETLGGIRDPEKILEALSSTAGDRLTIALLGRESGDIRGVLSKVPLHVVVEQVKYKKVRNARIIAIARYIDRARARFRLGAKWGEEASTYIFDHRGDQIFPEVNPAYDVFLMSTPLAVKALEEFLGFSLHHPLLLRKMGGEHEVYDCGRYAGRILFPDVGPPRLLEGRRVHVGECSLDVRRTVEANRDPLFLLESLSRGFLRTVEGVKRVFVPLSGGKDSTAALLLAVDVYGRRSVRAVYVDTGVDFEENRVAAEKIARSLGVKLDMVYAPVKEGIATRGLPLHENRWCTGLKVEALHGYLESMGADEESLVVVGDRDAESRSRSRRPPLRREGGWRVAAPLKLWGTQHVTLYLASRNVLWNKLYDIGFYRTGCFICPSLRGWEIALMEKRGLLERLVAREPSIMGRFLCSKRWLSNYTLDDCSAVES